MRLHPRYLLVLLMLVLATVVAGCAGEDDASNGDSKKAVDTSSALEDAKDSDGEQAEAELEVVLQEVGGKDGLGIPVPAGIKCTKSIPATCNTAVTCPAADDATDDQQEVCVWLNEAGGELLTEEIPENEACTMIYGGPTTATVTGTLNGEEIDTTFSRQDGCAISRFDAAAPLWTGTLDPPPAATPGAATPPPSNPDAPVSSPPEPEPRVVDDPPEAFELEK